MIGTWVGLRYYLARKYDSATEQSHNIVELNPDFAAARLILGESYVQQCKEGLDELRKAAALSGDSPLYVAQVGVGLALAGERKPFGSFVNCKTFPANTMFRPMAWRRSCRSE